MKKPTLKALAKALDAVAEHRDRLQELFDSEQEAFDAKSDKWRESEAGEKAESDLYALEEVISSLDAVTDAIGNIELGD